MPEYTVTNLALQVEEFRNAQNLAFVLSAKYLRSQSQDDYEEANRVMGISKQLEKALDDTIRDILHGPAFNSRVLIDMETYQERIDKENDALAENTRLKFIGNSLLKIMQEMVDVVNESEQSVPLEKILPSKASELLTKLKKELQS